MLLRFRTRTAKSDTVHFDLTQPSDEAPAALIIGAPGHGKTVVVDEPEAEPAADQAPVEAEAPEGFTTPEPVEIVAEPTLEDVSADTAAPTVPAETIARKPAAKSGTTAARKPRATTSTPAKRPAAPRKPAAKKPAPEKSAE
ncbi:hypothetical protein GCM10025867_49820 (plasmid) [Frondihabitans sucicola]|uniref:Uncharacterized protein n=1 Tax=Frondihabitans sucicola TaxID=1268041 RepID=A0ABN6Y9S3_9MICO|nr:hypothetical protein [Frondihabitans sucicola]BDZ52741.1 hypothetical protein GCM10025867_49820 [Frondihabitans sucicola]